MTEINIQGIDKSDLLIALYNHAKPLGMGFLHYDPRPLEKDEAEQLIEEHSSEWMGKSSIHFDYLKGRLMKVDIGGDFLITRAYDRDNGDNAGYNAIKHLLQ